MNTLLGKLLNQQRARIASMDPSEAGKEWTKHKNTYEPEGKTPEQNYYACVIQDLRYSRALESAA